jgi:Na+-translocating ferredoxin:NAD+ oxidoreductase subunit G
MKEIVRITFRLTLSCFLAALVMGGAFIFTDKAKKHNEHSNFNATMLSLLGYGKQNPSPKELKFYPVYRYIVEEKGMTYSGYMVPVKTADHEAYEFLMLTLEGTLAQRYPLKISLEDAVTDSERQEALQKTLKAGTTVSYQDQTVIARLGDKRVAYLLPGKFTGFKTFIKVMLALDPQFDIIGLEIMEHEEDPGLGAEINQDYFKNQFKNKTYERLKTLTVIKEPLPDEYRRYLESPDTLSPTELETIRNKNNDKDIYALTGATISSRAVTSGVQGVVKRFVYRIKILDGVISSRRIPALI